MDAETKFFGSGRSHVASASRRNRRDITGWTPGSDERYAARVAAIQEQARRMGLRPNNPFTRLSAREQCVIVALRALGKPTWRELAQATDIPITSLRRVVYALINRNLMMHYPGRPRGLSARDHYAIRYDADGLPSPDARDYPTLTLHDLPY